MIESHGGKLRKLGYDLNRVRAMPLAKLAQKIAQRVMREADTIASEFRARVSREEPNAAQTLAAPAFWRGHKRRGLFLAPEEWRERIELLSQVEPAAKRLIVAEADRICAHTFDLLGSGPRYLGESIDWHVDFKSGHRFNPKTYYKRIRPASYPGGYDIKVPWELSRCHHLVRLGQAWHLTGDTKYADEFVAQVSQWIESNRYGYGVNWASSMEVAIRAVNWLWGLALVIESPSIDDKFLVQLSGSLLMHGQHIMNNLERLERGYAGNHYLANLVGLVHLGICCPFLNPAKDWLAFGSSELWKETIRQVNADGVSHEGSIPYHRLVAEMLVCALLICKKNSIPVPQEVMERVESMLRFIAGYTKPDGTAPIIGDQDNGRLLRMGVWAETEKEWIEHANILAIGARLFPDNDLFSQAPSNVESIWLAGGDNKQDLPQSNDANPASCAFPVSGFYIMRHRDLYLILKTGTELQFGLGHTHNDISSFELYAYDKTFITDTGTCTYTNDFLARNRFRSSSYHNVLVVDGEEINSISPYEPFRIGSDAHAMVQRWETGAHFDLIQVEHNGYQRLRSPVQHRRSIYFDKSVGLYLIRDDALGTGSHQLTPYYHFAPMRLHKHHASPIVWTDADGANLGLYILGVEPDTVSIEEGCISPSYGVVIQAPVVKCSIEVELPYTFFTVLYPSIDKQSDWEHSLLQAAEHPWLSSVRQKQSVRQSV